VSIITNTTTQSAIQPLTLSQISVYSYTDCQQLICHTDTWFVFRTGPIHLINQILLYYCFTLKNHKFQLLLLNHNHSHNQARSPWHDYIIRIPTTFLAYSFSNICY